MARPPNVLPIASPGPFGTIDMNGMFTVLKVREGINNYDDPGWYTQPSKSATQSSLKYDSHSKKPHSHQGGSVATHHIGPVHFLSGNKPGKNLGARAAGKVNSKINQSRFTVLFINSLVSLPVISFTFTLIASHYRLSRTKSQTKLQSKTVRLFMIGAAMQVLGNSDAQIKLPTLALLHMTEICLIFFRFCKVPF